MLKWIVAEIHFNKAFELENKITLQMHTDAFGG